MKSNNLEPQCAEIQKKHNRILLVYGTKNTKQFNICSVNTKTKFSVLNKIFCYLLYMIVLCFYDCCKSFVLYIAS